LCAAIAHPNDHGDVWAGFRPETMATRHHIINMLITSQHLLIVERLPTAGSLRVHPKAASSGAVALVQTFEAAVIAEKATREKRLAEARARLERVKAVAEQAKTALALRALDPTSGAA
jgi:hypothetical protein